MNATRLISFCWIACVCFSGVLGQSIGEYDVILSGGRIIDGTGSPWFYGDIAIRDGKIAAVGSVAHLPAAERIDASGLVIAPGFVDMMGQTASPMLDDPKTALNLLTQGITTINCGEGGSAAPLNENEDSRKGWTTFAEYFALLDMNGLPVNVVQTVGHTQVRRLVLGDVDRRPSAEELAQMQSHVKEGMEAGAIGVSTALIYPPAIYAPTQEIAALASVAGQYGGRYFTHMRNEGDRLLEAIDEALDIGAQSEASVHIFHLKAAGQQNWPKMQQAIDRIRTARATGQQVTADIYPYINNGLGISALIRPEHFAEGRQRFLARLRDPELRQTIRGEMEGTAGWENWFRHAGSDWSRIIIGQSNHPKYRPYDGSSVAAMAEALDEDPWDTFFALVESGAFALPETMSVDNKILAMQQEFVAFCTDVGPANGNRSASHPRAFGSFPRLLSKYVRDHKAISLERAVAQASATACNHIFAFDRGRIAVGLAADLVVFAPDEVDDQASFADPHAVSKGIHHVLVNGKAVLRDGEFTGERPGRVLRGPGYRESRAPWSIASGAEQLQFASFDNHVAEFMREHRVPGISIAATKAGTLRFARGYGYADLAAGERVSTKSRFRIASISKPITAVAILKLCEQGKVNLDSKVLEILTLENQIASAGNDFDKRWRQITLRHLLQHRGGWDRDKSFDAMFQSIRFAEEQGTPPPADPATVIASMLGQPLDFDPGERYAYSNFGYCLLGRVIEKVSRKDYQSYVQQEVLKPLGITSMSLGKTRLKDRQPSEVRFYHPGQGTSVFEDDLNEPTPHPYGAWHLEAMDSHGGWLATAEDLAKFAAAFDNPENCPILTADSIRKMFERPPGEAGFTAAGEPKEVFYSLGWLNRVLPSGKTNHWHTGSLPGTAAILIRRYDGVNLIALINSRKSPSSNHLGRSIDRLLHRAANEVENWELSE